MADSMTLRGRARLFVLLGGLTAFGPLSIDMYLPALPAIGRDLAASESLIQLTLTACLIGLAIGQVVAGPISDALGRRRPLLIGVAGYVLASLLCAVAPTAPILVSLRLLQGLAGAAGIVIARAIVRDLYTGSAAARYFSRLILIFGIAPILAPVLGAQMMRFTSWHGIFLALAVVTALLWLGAARALPETLPVERRRSGSLGDTVQTFRRLAADTRFLGYAVSGGLGFGAMFAYIAGSPFVLQGIYHVSPQTFSLIFGLNAVGFVITSQINGSLVGRIPPARLLTVGVTVTGVAGLALLAVILIGGLGLAAVLPPLFVLVSSIGFVVPNAVALALSRHPEAAGTGSALVGVIQSGIGAAGAPLVGIAGITTALPMAVVIATSGVGAVLARLLTSIRRERGQSSSPLAEEGGVGNVSA
ncbi:MAG TPA: Bcr/CflA family multidrug efflux MFS transporter [Candidatus Dormibacteraeota bacterium]|nr:Bcr/CflA family multidrug efflux MFS transporter [Candidatus Dormibacteraeota bacterium]